ncbi:hypothetical protein [Pedobacter sp. GR22-6]|uniref:hypothetical protein n=1 Tax=Pedobacter sp. GR22-6 TaxID=3127957 RepID=UPI00307F1CB4
MKALQNFTNVDKAKMIHELFPQEMPALIDFIKGMCVSIKANEAKCRSEFWEGLFTFDYWLHLLKLVEDVIDNRKKLLCRSSKAFSKLLFEGYLACFSNHCVQVYTSQFKHPNQKFNQAIELFYY